MTDVEAIAARIRAWRLDPVLFVQECLGVDPDEWQKEALRALPTKGGRVRICLKACAGPGKSACMAWAMLWFLTCWAAKGEHPNAAAVSITADTLKDTLWKELSVWHGRSKFLQAMFTWTAERIFANDHASTWFASARAFSKSANADEQGRTLSGLHSKFIFYALDETGDMPPAVLRSAEQGLSNCEVGVIMQAGNPTSTSGMLYLASTQQRDRWNVVTITADPADPKRTPRVDPVWAQEQIDTWGRDNPWVQAYILGQFPSGSLDTLLSVEDVEKAMARNYIEDAYAFSQKRLGVDVARQGDDCSALFARQGLRAFAPVILRNADTLQVAGRVALGIARFGPEQVMVDGTGGYGAGVVDALLQAGHAPIEVQFAGKPQDPRFQNARAEMWFRMAEWVKGGGQLPKDETLVRELTQPKIIFTTRGKFQLEDKEQIKKRLGFSPDRADALAMTFAFPEMPRLAGLPGELSAGVQKSAVHDYDPHA